MLRRVVILCILIANFVDASGPLSPKGRADSVLRKIFQRHRRDSSTGVSCGGNLTVSSIGGSLTSPNWPNSYPGSSDCVWFVTSPQTRNIVINITRLDIENQETCDYDYLDVFVGPEVDTRVEHLCGDKTNYIIATNDTQVKLVFKSDISIGGTGFVVNFLLEPADHDESCPREVNKNHGTFTSPGWPEEYPGNKDCWTLIRVDSDKTIFFNFQEIALEPSENCDYDFVEVFDGPDEDYPKIGRFCKLSDSTLLKSTNNTLVVHFHSDSLISDKGFKGNFTTSRVINKKDHIGECHWERNERNGTIASPGYPSNYPSNTLCTIQIEAPKDNTIKIEFSHLNIEEDDLCGYDWVELREGDQKESTLLAKLCGTNSSVLAYQSKSNKILVLFQSDSFFSLDGFFLTYTFHEDERKMLSSTQTSSNKAGPKAEFATYPSNTTVEEGKVHVLSCSPRDPEAHVRWFKDGDFIGGRNIPKGIVLVTNNTLKIESMSSSHVGIYKCVLVLPDTMKTATAWIGIQFNATDCPLELRTVPHDVTWMRNEYGVLDCSGSAVASNGSIRINWEKNGSPLVFNRRLQSFSNGSISIKRAHPGDQGIYTCVATLLERNCEKRASAKVVVIQEQNTGEVCGLPKTDLNADVGNALEHGKIVGGTTAERGRHPWQVMVWDPDFKAFCGGALLNERWFMTAAHCFLANHIQWDKVQIQLGKIDQVESEPGEFITSIGDIVIHPSFEGGNSFDHDMALVRLKESVKFSDYILPVCLGERNFIEDNFFHGRHFGSVAGWGKLAERGSTPRLLKEIKLPTVEWPICKATRTNTKVTRNMFCAGYEQEIVADSCSGDSGGPFVVQDKGRHYAIGIVSWGEGCARKGQYGFYTKVTNYHSWIKAIIQT